MRGKTGFAVAHRLPAIRDADWIFVISEGDIVEQDAHKDLLRRGGFYAEFYNGHFAPV